MPINLLTVIQRLQLLKNLPMGSLISQIDQKLAQNTDQENGQIRISQFHKHILQQMNLVCMGQKQDIENRDIILKSIDKISISNIGTPVKLGQHTIKKSKQVYSKNPLSLASNSRIINIKTHKNKQKNNNQQQFQKMYILKKKDISNNTQNIEILDAYIQKSKSFTFLKNCCNLIKYKKNQKGYLCATKCIIEGLFQYEGSYTLQEQILVRNCENSQQFSVFEVMKIFKFILALFKQFKANKLDLPILSLNHIIITHKNSLKYRNILDIKIFDEGQDIRTFYCPSNFGKRNSSNNFQKQAIFSFGMCMLSVCLLSDLSDCYDFTYNSLCISILQTKIQQLKQKKESEYWISFCESIQAMVAPQPQDRPSLQQISSMCNNFLAQMRVHDCDSTQIMLSEISTCYNRIKPQPIKIYNNLDNQKQQSIISGRSCQKQIEQINKNRKDSELSGSKCLTARWQKGSSKKKQMKNSFKKKHLNLDIGKQNINIEKHLIFESTKQQTNPFEQIDKKWKSQEQVFKNMPQFHQNPDEQFMFQIELNCSKQISRRKSETQTLLTYRKIL